MPHPKTQKNKFPYRICILIPGGKSIDQYYGKRTFNLLADELEHDKRLKWIKNQGLKRHRDYTSSTIVVQKYDNTNGMKCYHVYSTYFFKESKLATMFRLIFDGDTDVKR